MDMKQYQKWIKEHSQQQKPAAQEKQSTKYARQIWAIIAELERRYKLTQDALFLDLMRAGINYAAARALESYDDGARSAAGGFSPEELVDPSNPDSPTWYDMI